MVTQRRSTAKRRLDEMVAEGLAERQPRVRSGDIPQIVLKKKANASDAESAPHRINAKRKGTNAEHRSMALLEAAGYRCTRSAASLGVWDIVGIGSTDLVLVQVKAGLHWPGTVEMEALREFVVPPNARKLVHRWRKGARMPDVREL